MDSAYEIPFVLNICSEIKNKILIFVHAVDVGKNIGIESIISYLLVDKREGLGFFKGIPLLMTPVHIKHVS